MGERLFNLVDYARGVRMAMAADDLSYRDAAVRIGMSPATLNRIAKARNEPDVENYLRIERWLNSRPTPERPDEP